MTLVLTIASQWGIWQCMDTRLTDIGTGKPSDVGVKYVSATCPDGRFLLSYSGIGKLSDTRETSEWVRDCLRGETRTIDASLITIRDAATRDLARYMLPSWFVIGARFNNGDVWVAAISNLELASNGSYRDKPLRRFDTNAWKVDGRGFYAPAGSGATAIDPGDAAALNRVKGKRPKEPNDLATLLAGVNERVSRVDRFVSAACVTATMPAGAGVEERAHHGASSSALYHLLYGLDTTPMTSPLIEAATQGGGPPVIDTEAAVRPGPRGSRPRRRPPSA